MPIEIKWDALDEDTGERRWYLAEKFARQWHFKMRRQRRGIWDKVEPTRDMWEEVLDSLRRRVNRREGVEPEDIAFAEKALAELPAKDS